MNAVERAAEVMGRHLHKLNRHNMYAGRCDSCEHDARSLLGILAANQFAFLSDVDRAVLDAAKEEFARHERTRTWMCMCSLCRAVRAHRETQP